MNKGMWIVKYSYKRNGLVTTSRNALYVSEVPKAGLVNVSINVNAEL